MFHMFEHVLRMEDDYSIIYGSINEASGDVPIAKYVYTSCSFRML